MPFPRHSAVRLAIFVSAIFLSTATPALAGWSDPVVVDTSPPIDDGVHYFRGDADSLGLGMTPAGILRVVRASGRGTWARNADQDGPVASQQSLNYGDFALGSFGDSLETEWLSSASTADGTMAAGLSYGKWLNNPHPGGFEGWKIGPEASPGLFIRGNRNWNSSPTIQSSVALSPNNSLAAAWSEAIAGSRADPDQCRVLFSSPAVERPTPLATYEHPSCGKVSVTSLTGGAWLVAWVDGRWGPDDVSKINLAHVAADGSFHELLFLPTMVSGRVRGGERSGLPLVSTTDGDALLAWRDDRGVVTLPISATGTVGSVEIVTRDAGTANLSLRSGAGSEADPVLAWSTGDGTTTRLHAARLNSSGSIRWTVSIPEVRGVVNMDAIATPAGRAVLTWRSRNLHDPTLDTIRAAEISTLGYLNPTQIVGSGRGGGSFQGRVVRVASSTTNHVAIAWSNWEAINASWDGYIFPTPEPLPANCPDVYAVGVRGSRGSASEPSPTDESFDERRTHDDVIKLFMDRLTQRSGLDIQRLWIRYPAAPASNALHSWRDPFRTEAYNSSVDDGIEELKARLTDLQRPGGCVSRGTQIALAGYSQGAQVIGRAVDDGMNMTGVKAVSLFGDPTFSADHSGDATYTSTLGIAPTGILGGRTKDFPSNVFVTSFCRPYDFVCDAFGGTLTECTRLSSVCELFPEHVRYKDPVVVRSGPFWDYDEKILPPPPVQSADKVVTQALRMRGFSGARNTSTDAMTTRHQGMSARVEPDSTDEPPVAVLPSRLHLRPNQPLLLSAGLSHDPNGGLLLYEWDLNGDGRYDALASLAPAVATSFATTPAGRVRLRVTNEVGRRSTTDLVVEVSPAGDSQPAAPTSVRGTPGPRSVTLQWDMPTDTGGLPITSYLVSDANTGDLVGFADSSTHVTLTAQTPGVARRFTVAARNEIGVGPASAPSASITPTADTPLGGTSRPPQPSTPFGIVPSDSAQTPPPVSGMKTPSDGSPKTPFSVSIKTIRLSRRQLERSPTFPISYRVSMGAVCSIKVTLKRSTAQRLRLKIKKGATTLTVARGRATLRKGGSAILRLRTTSRFRSAVRQHRRKLSLTVTATAVNSSGEHRTVSRLMRMTR